MPRIFFPTLNTIRFHQILKEEFDIQNNDSSPEPLLKLLRSLRAEDIELLLAFLSENENIRQNLANYLQVLFQGRHFNYTLTEANILSESSFIQEFKKRTLSKLLPAIEDPDTVSWLVNQLFYRGGADIHLFNKVSDTHLLRLMKMLDLDKTILRPGVKKELLFSMNFLAWRSIGHALDAEIIRMAPEYKSLTNPFLSLQDELDALRALVKVNPNFQFTDKDPNYKQLNIYLEQSNEFVKKAFKNAALYGISPKTNQSLLRISQQLRRIEDILNLLKINSEEEVSHRSLELIRNVLRYKSTRNDISSLIGDSTNIISHQITTHAAVSGVHYITSNLKGYMLMFWRASGGGIIVGALCVLKMMYSYLIASEFSHAVLYSLNYAFGFVMIYLLHFTLATKQPAMTAATMAHVLSSDEHRSNENYRGFAHLVSNLFRTQFIAFLGNALWAVPSALAIIYGLECWTGENLASLKADKLLKNVDFLRSKALLHASLAGFYLFLSGIISGSVSNNANFYQIPQRIAQNPYIISILGKHRAQSLSRFYEKKYPGILSNILFGVFMGITAPVGAFLGLDLDIRHITFSAGNMMLGIYGKGFNVSNYTLWMSLVTVMLIGFFNFVVSFGLSMMLAFRSRQVTYGESSKIYYSIF